MLKGLSWIVKLVDSLGYNPWIKKVTSFMIVLSVITHSVCPSLP